MTTQIPDSFQYRDRGYSIAGINGGKLFDPEKYGIQPAGRCTACYRGFASGYALFENCLALHQLSVSLNRPAPDLFGVKPVAPEQKHSFWSVVYRDLRCPLEFSGGLLIARSFIRGLYGNMCFRPAWVFEEVHELIFDAGKLTQATDRSTDIAKYRNKIAESESDSPKRGVKRSRDEIVNWIDPSFSLKYDGLFW